MLDFLKQKKTTTPAVVGDALVQLAKLSEKEAAQALEFVKVVFDESRLKPEQFLAEVFLLQVFAVYWTAFNMLADNPFRDEVFVQFHKSLNNLETLAEVPSEARGFWQSRVAAYSEVYEKEASGMALVKLGKKFSEFCEEECDAQLMMLASVQFSGTAKGVAEFLGGIGIVAN